MQKYSYLCIMLLLFACAPKKTKAPSDMLTQSQMSDVLSEMHVADAIVSSTKAGNQDSINQEKVNLRAFILHKYNIGQTQFQESFEYYQQNPVLMDSVYAEVITKLSNEEIKYRGK